MDTTRISMGSPADLRLHSDAPLRLFTVTEADALVPQLEHVFRRLDPKLARLRELRELIEDAESYFGEGLLGAPRRTATRMRCPSRNNRTLSDPSKPTSTRSTRTAANSRMSTVASSTSRPGSGTRSPICAGNEGSLGLGGGTRSRPASRAERC